MWRLIGVQGIYKGRFFDLSEGNIIVGKGEDCSIKLSEDDTIAAKQAEMVLCNGNYVFRDLDTHCKTLINGTEHTGMQALNPGDIIQIGESTFRLEQPELANHATTATISPQVKTSSHSSYTLALPRISLSTPVIMLTLAVLVVLSVAIPRYQASKAHHARYEAAKKTANDAMKAIGAIGSATTVGVKEQDYGRKVIDAQAQIDAFNTEYSESEFANFGSQLQDAIKPYALASTLWNYMITEDMHFISHDNPQYNECEAICPEAMKSDKEGGVLCNGDYLYNSVYIDGMIQRLWNKGRVKVAALKFPSE